MTFFDRILDPANNIVCDGTDKDGNYMIRQCMEVYKNSMYIANNLKMVCTKIQSTYYTIKTTIC